MKRFVVLEKQVGQTPLECAEAWRASQGATYQDVPLSYAGRLDPMASGKLLLLIGEECKLQTLYHDLDKTYEFEVLFGIRSDSGDVLGIIEAEPVAEINSTQIKNVCKDITGTIRIPYPHFSSKTVNGKPLHTWTLEGRLSEIDIPTKHSTIHSIRLKKLRTVTHDDVFTYATEKIETIPPVTDVKKAIGNDFRRPDVRASWKTFNEARPNENYQVATLTCTCSSGTYMRSLAEVIARRLGTVGLAYSIHRSHIGEYKTFFGIGYWSKEY